MKPIKKMRISTMIVEAIEEMIIAENIQPGDKLPSENVLARRLEVSRTLELLGACNPDEASSKMAANLGNALRDTENYYEKEMHHES